MLATHHNLTTKKAHQSELRRQKCSDCPHQLEYNGGISEFCSKCLAEFKRKAEV